MKLPHGFKPQFKKKDIRSYVIRAGRITAGQSRAFEQHWQRYGLDLFAGPVDLHACFGRTAPLVLEIGFGMGDSLLAMAQREPEKNFIGIEVHPPGVGSLINNAASAGVDNLRVFMADAIDVLDDCIPAASIDRLQLYFPDPWHKKKHHKRRIVQLAFMEKLHNKLQHGGLVHMATDWEAYAEHMMEVLTQCDWLENSAGEYCFSERPEYRPVTKFEQRGERLGHGVWDLIFRKRNGD